MLSTLVNSPMPVTQTPQRFSGVGAITDGPLLPSGPVTPARSPLKFGALPFNVKPAELKPLLPARMSSMRRFRLAVCTFASETPMLKIDASASGAIRLKSLQSWLSGWSLRKAISVDARGSPTALSSAWATDNGVRCAGSLDERALRPFEQDGVRKINDLGFHDGAGGDLTLDRTERPAHPSVCGEECDLVADMEFEATQPDKLERAAEAGMAIHCKEVVLARDDSRFRCARCRLRSGCSCQ